MYTAYNNYNEKGDSNYKQFDGRIPLIISSRGAWDKIVRGAERFI